MKTIGLVGGISWPSTIDYYRICNEQMNARLGGNSSARIVIYSVNFGEIEYLTHRGEWEQIAEIIGHAAQMLERAGANCVLLGANTMHKIADRVQSAVSIPLLHIAVETGRQISERRIRKVALLGTRYTMEMGFFADKLGEMGIETIIPSDTEDREIVHQVIYRELGKGIIRQESKDRYLRIIDQLVQEGAEGIILGCTEIPMLIQPDDCQVPVFNTTLIHASAAVDVVLAAGPVNRREGVDS